jgi:glucose-6-phosphate isomerase
LAVAGIPVRELLNGAVEAYRFFENDPDHILNYSAYRLACYRAGVALDVIGSFEPEFKEFTGWIQQLFGESEGKEGKGLFPIGVSYSTDLHSLGQMIQEGERNVMETFLVLRKTSEDAILPSYTSDDDGLEYLAGRSLFEINQMALNGTVKAHSDGGVPIAVITLDELSAASLGALLYFYELTTAVYGYTLGVNPFDQPGVEAYKAEMRKLLHIAPSRL